MVTGFHTPTHGLFELPNYMTIREMVEEELCNKNQLLPKAFPITERLLRKQGNTCGVFYCLHGPRSIRLTAVLDIETARVLFYDSTGQRAGVRCVKDLVPSAA
jgi:hypothetical protein